MASVTSISIQSAGGPYSVAPTVTISLPDADSAAAGVTATIDSNGKVSSLSLNDGGTYYLGGETISFSDPDEPKKPVKFTASLSNNAVDSLTIDSGGSFYITNPALIFSPPTGDGAPAIGSVVLNDSGYISSVNIVDSGLYYEIVPIARLNYYIGDSAFTTQLDVEVTDSKVSSLAIPSGSPVIGLVVDSADINIDPQTGAADNFRATATAAITDGRVTGYNITFRGAGYTTPPTIAVEGPTGEASGFLPSATLTVANGVVTAVQLVDSGNFYLSAPTVTVQAGSGSANDFRATATAEIDSIGGVTSITVTDGGLFYNNAPSVSFTAPPQQLDFRIGEIIEQRLSGGVKIQGEVSDWDNSIFKLGVIHVGADDGKYHEFVSDVLVTGQTSGARGNLFSVTEDNQLSENEQNEDFNTESADFLDFSESNPFGDPENN